ncbi:MAG: hypothetical protein NT150_00350, partial [Bacteroidetes bacterium]|nr:hypothetical protein [Bacteroidota bacterium]
CAADTGDCTSGELQWDWNPGADSRFAAYEDKYWEQLYQCIYTYDTITNLKGENFGNMAIDGCQQACELRYTSFKEELITTYHNDSIYVEGDVFELRRDTTWGFSIFSSIGDSLESDPDFVALDQIECTAMSLVDHCKTYCEMTSHLADSMGTPAERAKVMKAMTWGFELSFPEGGTCGSGWDLVTGYTDTRNVTGNPVDPNITKTKDFAYGGDMADNLTATIKTSDGGYLLVGYTLSDSTYDVSETSNGDVDYWAVKISKEGKILWDRLIGGSSSDYLRDAVELNNGDFALVGYSSSTVSGDKTDERIGSNEDFWVVKLNKYGTILWDSTYGGTATDRAYTVIQTLDGNILLTGASGSGISGDKTESNVQSDYWLVKINTDGTLLWEETLVTNGNDFATYTVELPDTSLIIVGTSDATNTTYDNSAAANGSDDYWLVKMDKTRNVVWDKMIGGTSSEYAPKIVKTLAGNIVFAGSTSSNSTGDIGSNSGGEDIAAFKVNITNGNLIWSQMYGGSGDESASSLSIDLKPSAEEGFYLITTSGSNITGNKTENIYGGSDYWILKCAEDGSIDWDKTIGGSSNEEGHSIEISYNSDSIVSYLFAGRSPSNVSGKKTQNSKGDNDYWVVFGRDYCPGDSVCFRWVENPEIVIDSNTIVFTPLSCDTVNGLEIKNSIRSQVSAIIAKQVAAFKSSYNRTCANPDSISDNLVVSYNTGYYHYTLYYYDRAGNLTSTVPPKGVDLSSTSRLDHPSHTYVSKYNYNSLQSLVQQTTPDGGTGDFCYDSKGRLRFSQNAQQAIDGTYSYTKYDALGRIIEVGQSSQSTSTRCANVDDSTFPSSSKTQRTYTVYTDQAPSLTYLDGSRQTYLQNRVSYTYNDDNVYSYFSYDIHGNVQWLVQQVPGIGKSYVKYEYDLVSNKVLAVHYNEGRADQFHQYYEYDADSRITKVYSSRETQNVVKTSSENIKGRGTIVKGKYSGIISTKEAHYDYFKHGPLKRTELGNDNVQGTDYTYTIHGWLKAVNHPSLVSTDDPGLDGYGGSTFGKDVFGMALGYYEDDFKRTSSPFNTTNTKIITSESGQNPLYNGNISSWTVNTGDGTQSAGLSGNIYRYDYMNRLIGVDYRRDSANTWVNSTTDYDEQYAYDGNGNILTLSRNGYAATSHTAMDKLSYKYLPNTNKLDHVDDAVSSTYYGTDVDDQDTNNYAYDAIGNLTKDTRDSITRIKWTVFGKVDSVIKSTGVKLHFLYDPTGQRVAKEVITTSGTDVTYYSKDASGIVMSIYERTSPGDSVYLYKQKEVPIYGSDRISTYKDNLTVLTTNLSGDPVTFPCWCPQDVTVATYHLADVALLSGEGVVYSRDLLKREYELKDHLGSVRALVQDRKDSVNGGVLIAYENAYSGGSSQPNRSYSRTDMRYGMNGQEKDDEIANGIYTALYWEYDSR